MQLLAYFVWDLNIQSYRWCNFITYLFILCCRWIIWCLNAFIPYGQLTRLWKWLFGTCHKVISDLCKWFLLLWRLSTRCCPLQIKTKWQVSWAHWPICYEDKRTWTLPYVFEKQLSFCVEEEKVSERLFWTVFSKAQFYPYSNNIWGCT